MEQPRELLKKVFGYDSFRPGQQEIVEQLLAGRDVLAVMPTGAGKSICYQLPALVLPGITVVVSPLVSLMQDQVRALVAAGVKAAYLNSSLTDSQKALMLRRACEGWYKIIYVAPERLVLPGFLRLAAVQPISMVVVDEAHCISQWGQDFRPSYLKIMDFVQGLPVRPVVGAFTATATARVKTDIAAQLALQNPYALTTSFDRPNLYFAVQHSLPSKKPAALLEILRREGSEGGIVYCSTTRQVDETVDMLREHGYTAAPYHAKLPAEVRRKNQEDFIYDTVPIIVATNAFGMGIDKPNVRFVVHYNMPKDLESYYQEAGRAGRDGDPADCILLYTAGDVRTIRYFIEQERDSDSDTPADVRAEAARKAEERLKWMTFYATTKECLRGFILKYFGERPPLACGHCGSCDAREEAKRMAAALAAAPARPKARRAAVAGAAPPDAFDEKLLAALYRLRMRLANKRKVPAYMIFSDATARDIVAKKPVSQDELLGVSGIGEAKANAFGRQIVDLVKELLASREEN